MSTSEKTLHSSTVKNEFQTSTNADTTLMSTSEKTLHSSTVKNEFQTSTNADTTLINCENSTVNPKSNFTFNSSIQYFISFFDILTADLLFLMTNCLTNCTNNGKCKLNNNEKFICECDEHYIGTRCQIDSRPCASNPCMNGAKCFNDFIKKIYKCECVTKNGSVLFYGANCEKKIDVCENETCSKNGVCYDVENEPKCKCFKSYSGEKCQVESQEIKTVKTLNKSIFIYRLRLNHKLDLEMKQIKDTSSMLVEKSFKEKFLFKKILLSHFHLIILNVSIKLHFQHLKQIDSSFVRFYSTIIILISFSILIIFFLYFVGLKCTRLLNLKKMISIPKSHTMSFKVLVIKEKRIELVVSFRKPIQYYTLGKTIQFIFKFKLNFEKI
ncbi:crumbs -like protein [Brachionus plicatilis]|uniref:Crumbs-like protein n=1 Tax=Brachionus plicatilis TaxID=10195 RepID=A0A3M7REH0_BRAPC|nr:crumbs -like protein [Brachionus plicatilis]